MPATRPLCLLCKAVEGKYKCPRCSEYTCSVTCSREHRDNHPTVKEEPKPAPQPEPTPASTPLEASCQPKPTVLSDFIADAPEYQALKKRYPFLEQCLLEIAAATDPPKTTDNTARPGRRNQPWTQDVGMSNAVQMVQTIKASPGDVRDAIREFSELVSILKERMEIQEDQRIRERREHDARVIGKMFREEKA
ncbi:hypothetical protein F5Y16DRAFT_397498 [Xylariaceae sp. FL0255]|nr:hypothetical protein F5Y16DRAFT_397498 [Xylariaceae sp. FL0255]